MKKILKSNIALYISALVVIISGTIVINNAIKYSSSNEEISYVRISEQKASVVDALSNSLIARYSFDEGSGNTTKDQTGANSNAVFHGGVTWTDGKFGKALSFNGTDSFLEIATSSTMNELRAFSISVWVYLNNVDTDQEIIHRVSSNSFNGFLYLAFSKSDKSIMFDIEDASTEKHTYTYGPKNSVGANSWYHIVAVASGESIKVFVDGVQGNEVKISGLFPLFATQDSGDNPLKRMYIGSRIYKKEDYTAPIRQLNGKIDELRIFNKALNQNEIAILSNGPSTSSSPDGPVRSNGVPSGTLQSGTDHVELSLKTDIRSRCVYSTTPNISYMSEANKVLDFTNSTEHRTTVWNLVPSTNYNYYIRCLGFDGSVNNTDYAISFDVAQDNNNQSVSQNPSTISATPSTVPAIQPQSEEFSNQNSLVHTSFDYFKRYYQNTMAPLLKSGDTHQLYNLQYYTNNYLVYAERKNDIALLDDLLTIYLDPYQYLKVNEKGEHQWLYTNSSVYPGNYYPSLLNQEVLLYNGQFMYVVAKSLNIISKIPESNRTPTMNLFLEKYSPITVEFYDRWSKDTKPVFIKQINNGPSLNTTANAVSDARMWVIVGLAEFMSAQKGLPSKVIITSSQQTSFREFIDIGIQLLQQRLSESNLTNFSGNFVKGLNFDLGKYDSYIDNSYSGYTGLEFPGWKVSPSETVMPTNYASNVGWDISHAERYVYVFNSLYENKDILGLSFPSRNVMVSLTNQIIYGAFNKDLNYPLFSNFMDGTNGWYRVNYSGRANFGYEPYSLSNAFAVGGYGFWSDFNPDIQKVLYIIYNLISGRGDSGAVAFWKSKVGDISRLDVMNVGLFLSTIPTNERVDSSSYFSKIKPISSPLPTPASCLPAGQAGSPFLNSCNIGTFYDTNDSATNYLWMCLGLNGGANTSCSLPKDTVNPTPTPTPIILRATNGICGSTLNSCTYGILRNTEDSATQYLWMCLGENSGFNDSCSQNRSIPPLTTNPPQNTTNTKKPTSSLNQQKPNSSGSRLIITDGNLNNTSVLTIPTTTIDVTLPKVPSWTDIILNLIKDTINKIKAGATMTMHTIFSILNTSSQKAQVLSPQTYYIDATQGNDSNTGLSTDQAWKTIAKVNSSTFNPGDQILFKRGETWREQLTVSSSGSSGSPIVIDAYGSGAKPTISGADTITGWTKYEGNIYVANVGSITPPTQLYVDGTFYDVAHYPNSGYLLATDDASNTTSIIDTGLTLTADQIVGANVNVRAVAWSITTRNSTAYDDVTKKITLDGNVFNSTQVMRKNYGLYLSNKLWMLDTPGEWYYDSSAGKLYLWATGSDDPISHTVEISKRSYGVYILNKSYITIQNLNIKYADKHDVFVDHSSNILLSNLDILGSQIGIRLSVSPNSKIQNNSIQNTLSNGIQAITRSDNSIISSNTVNNAGYVGSSPKNSNAGIYVDSPNSIISGNDIRNSGYNGIIGGGNLMIIENNTIDQSCLVLDDCAGIYTTNGNTLGGTAIVRGNTVSNSIGNYNGDPYGFTIAHGIYLDDLAHGYSVLNNTVHNTDIGIYIHSGYSNIVSRNIVHTSRTSGLRLSEDNAGQLPEEVGGVVHDNLITENVFESISSTASWPNGAAMFYSQFGPTLNFGKYDNNIYCYPNLSYPITHRTLSSSKNYSLADWQTFSGQDAHSTDIKGPCPDTLPKQLDPVSTQTPVIIPTPAFCSTSLNSCNTGTFSDTDDSTTHYLWNCLGLNEGTNASCSLPKDYLQNPPPPVATTQRSVSPYITTKINPNDYPLLYVPTTTIDTTTPKITPVIVKKTINDNFIHSVLKFGSRSSEVTILQEVLVREKLLAPAYVTGYYGTVTEIAVQKLQKKYKIISSGTPQTTGYGVVGNKTIALINALNIAITGTNKTNIGSSIKSTANNQNISSTNKITVNLSLGSRNPQVKTLQTILVQQNLLSPKYVTGYYGPITQTAVQKLQSKYGIISTGTPKTTGYGAVGPKTRKVVNGL